MNRRRLILGIIAALAVVWGCWLLLGRKAGEVVAAHWGAKLLKLGDGKFNDPALFVRMRLRDAAVLASAGGGLMIAMLAALPWSARISPRWRWAAQAAVLFVALNLFAAAASHTALFWCLLFTGRDHSHNYTQFQIKRLLMPELVAPRQAVLLGSSQTHVEIDKRLLNADMGDELWTTELHFPGSRCFDMVLCLDTLPRMKIDYIICYLSEGYFYSGVVSEVSVFFMNFQDLPQFYECGGRKVDPGRYFGYGLLGDALPLFRLREPLISRILGSRILTLSQDRHDRGLAVDLAERAKVAAPGYRFGPETDFQKRAFETFAKMCRERGARLVVCCGQNNPILGRALNPALRPDMAAYLENMAAHDTNIVLLDEAQLPVQTADDYVDLTHVDATNGARFTRFIEGELRKLIAAPPSVSAGHSQARPSG